MIYKGQSMAGTFCFGDYLVLETVPIDDICLGDVVVYSWINKEGEEEWVVHRAVSKTEDGVIVRGDKNLWPDPTPVTQSNFTGRVTHIIRGDKTFKVSSGLIGLSRVLFVRGFFNVGRLLYSRLRKLGRKPYAWLRQSNLAAMLWQPEIKKIQIMTEQGPVVKYIIGNRTVAEYRHCNKRLLCRKPYDLVLWSSLSKENRIPS